MNKIRILPDNLANQIAAGEVVERPASVVKELLENSIDAGATRINIDIELGGRRLMRISDDGEGMNRDDAILAFERHATSKIRKLEDLSTINTLGFRGEALASIASVAKIELVTKTADSPTAARVIIEGSRIVDVKDAARSQGTTISVRELFFNTPARRKFMRSEATENFHLTNIVTHYALAHPEISFAMTNNGREVLRVSTARSLRERSFQIFGRDLLDSLLEVNGGRDFIAKVSGYVSAPRERRTTRDAQYFFINGRFVRDKLISRGILEGYRNVLPHGVYPVALLFLEIPLEEVDVNVHPAKTEVRFRRAEAVKETIAEAIKKTLESANLFGEKTFRPLREESGVESGESGVSGRVSEAGSRVLGFESRESGVENEEPIVRAKMPPLENPVIEFPIESREPSFQSSETAEADFEVPLFTDKFESIVENRADKSSSPHRVEDQSTSRNQKSKIEDYAFIPPVDSALKATKAIEVEELNPGRIQPVGQLHQSYIIAVDHQGLLLIDQHVAHERILFDKFRRRENERRIESQNLLLPETFDLTPAQAAAFDLIGPELEQLGFALMRLSGRTIAIKSVPSDLPPSEVRNLLSEVLETVDADKRGNAIETIRDEIAASLACKAAVKVNMKLTPEKMQWMIDNLITNSAATTCPHGRPIILRLTMRDIERSFHRT
jgi:DNA mismatch repair protein MutL